MFLLNTKQTLVNIHKNKTPSTKDLNDKFNALKKAVILLQNDLISESNIAADVEMRMLNMLSNHRYNIQHIYEILDDEFGYSP